MRKVANTREPPVVVPVIVVAVHIHVALVTVLVEDRVAFVQNIVRVTIP